MTNLYRLGDQKTRRRIVSFDRRELSKLIDVYSRRVASGEWRDYAIDFRPGMARSPQVSPQADSDRASGRTIKATILVFMTRPREGNGRSAEVIIVGRGAALLPSSLLF